MQEKIKKIAVEAAKKAGKELLKEFNKFDRNTIKLKSKHEILTKADLIAEKIILKIIKNNFPDHAVLSEESGDNKKRSDYTWIVDPLDGTTNFSIHNPLWATSIGVAYKDEIVVGAVYAPYLDELFVASKGNGAYLNNKRAMATKMKSGKIINTYCHSNREKDIKKAIKYYQKQKMSGLDCRQLGSASIELGFVASGRTESIVIPGAHPWDVAAGVLLVKEAGGKVTDSDGSDWDLKSRDMIATNGKIHNQILKVFNSV